MPNQMTKRMLNKSLFNPKEGAIFWKVYVVFITSDSFKNEELFRVDLDSTKPSQKLSFAQEALIGVGIDGVNENKTLSEIFEKLVLSVRKQCVFMPHVPTSHHRVKSTLLLLRKLILVCCDLHHRTTSRTATH